ncbi:MAG: hypothetical protein P1U47_04945 [Zhongshania sp.]|uniref:hypothetical protein n=1 Tax=Zhongshania sp. TaxID=1971902 RepID=UPI002633C9D9|nr:hypothetical protein [Zhongshania sp.]MDF1691693.1 hypothetical protein [Zhongshania sp.]
MGKKSRISENYSIAEMLQLIEAAGSIESLYRSIPLLQRVFPGFKGTADKLAELKEQAKDMLVPDRFNDLFSSVGWIAYESMNLQTMKDAITICEGGGLDAAEVFLAESYDSETLKWGIQWFNGHPEFRKRIRLAELARDDYLQGRYHACVPLILSLLDGLVTDVSKHVGFFAENADLTAWDCIAAHESGLQSLASLMTKGRKKTNEQSVSVPYRHGILHGRELAFDNRIVAAKSWAALFAARDWAIVISKGKKEPNPPREPTWSELFASVRKNQEFKRQIDEWSPRAASELEHLPHSGALEALPEESPERAVAEFMDNWSNGRFGPIADALLYFTDTTKGKKAGLARQDFGERRPNSFRITGVEDQASSAAQVQVSAVFDGVAGSIEIELGVRAIYQGENNDPLVRGDPNGSWRIVQNSFSSVLYRADL